MTKIGDEVWVLDPYRRGERGEDGRIKARSRYVKRRIDGETSRSWVIGAERWNQEKFAKAWKYPARRFFTDAELDDEVFIEENRYKIGEAVQRSHDAAAMREIARLVGFVPKAEA